MSKPAVHASSHQEFAHLDNFAQPISSADLEEILYNLRKSKKRLSEEELLIAGMVLGRNKDHVSFEEVSDLLHSIKRGAPRASFSSHGYLEAAARLVNGKFKLQKQKDQVVDKRNVVEEEKTIVEDVSGD